MIFEFNHYLIDPTNFRLAKDEKAVEIEPLAFKPWFNFPNQAFLIQQVQTNLIFGYWASLKGNCSKKNHFALDTGCLGWKVNSFAPTR